MLPGYLFLKDPETSEPHFCQITCHFFKRLKLLLVLMSSIQTTIITPDSYTSIFCAYINAFFFFFKFGGWMKRHISVIFSLLLHWVISLNPIVAWLELTKVYLVNHSKVSLHQIILCCHRYKGNIWFCGSTQLKSLRG